MKKILLTIIVLCTLSLHAGNPLRFQKITFTSAQNNNFLNVEITIAGGTPDYTYTLQGTSTNPITTSKNSVTFSLPVSVASQLHAVSVSDNLEDTIAATIDLSEIDSGLVPTEVSFIYRHPTSGSASGEITVTNNFQKPPVTYDLNGSDKDSCTNSESCTFSSLRADPYSATTSSDAQAFTPFVIRVTAELVDVSRLYECYQSFCPIS